MKDEIFKEKEKNYLNFKRIINNEYTFFNIYSNAMLLPLMLRIKIDCINKTVVQPSHR